MGAANGRGHFTYKRRGWFLERITCTWIEYVACVFVVRAIGYRNDRNQKQFRFTEPAEDIHRKRPVGCMGGMAQRMPKRVQVAGHSVSSSAEVPQLRDRQLGVFHARQAVEQFPYVFPSVSKAARNVT
jgi:hypothetical protein